ncbi:MAG: NADPH-dependent reductase [Methanohalophilus sp.]|nr:MAG: NADPH-dependent reductase [Methanohalophilus sp.]
MEPEARYHHWLKKCRKSVFSCKRVQAYAPVLHDQIVVSVVVPMEKDSCCIVPDAKHMEVDVKDSAYNAEYFCYTQPAGGSAAEEIAKILPQNIRLVSGFHNVPAKHLEDLSLALDYDIAICGNDMASKEVVCKLTEDIPNLRPLDAGPLQASSMIESLTPLLINIAARNNMDDVGVKFI